LAAAQPTTATILLHKAVVSHLEDPRHLRRVVVAALQALEVDFLLGQHPL
jgi:hypothetical protein